MLDKIRKAEEEEIALYSRNFRFSEHLLKYEDDLLEDKYDHNFFVYEDGLSSEEVFKAIEHQYNKACDFVKFVGDKEIVLPDSFEKGKILTMALTNNDTSLWKDNKSLTFKKPSLLEIKENELNEFGDLYGRGFVSRNVDRLYNKQTYFGAYLDDKLVGYCLTYGSDDCFDLDELVVVKKYRKQYICTSIIKKIVEENQGKIIFLHADVDDTPKNIYANLGFEIVDYKYEYILNGLKDKYPSIRREKICG